MNMLNLKKITSIPIHIAKGGNLFQDVIDRVEGKTDRLAALPFFIKNADGSMSRLKRQCTSNYKIIPVQKKIREVLGVSRLSEKDNVNIWLGFSLDELSRVSKKRTSTKHNWERYSYPLVNLKSTKKWIKNFDFLDIQYSRSDCKKYLSDNGIKDPVKSSCIGCPFHNDRYWIDMRFNNPVEWKVAVDFDKKIRRLPGLTGECFLHRSGVPLDEVAFNQLDIFESNCVGSCFT